MAQENEIAISSQEIAITAILDRANSALEHKEFLQAQKILDSAKEISQDATAGVTSQILQIRLFIATRKIEKAAKLIQSLNGEIDPNSFLATDLLLVKAELELSIKDFEEAEKTLSGILNTPTSRLNSEQNITATYLMAGLLSETNRSIESTEEYVKVIPLLEEQKLAYLEAKAKLQLATLYLNQGEISAAKAIADEALTIAQIINIPFIIQDTYKLKSIIASKQGDHENAYSYLASYTIYKDRNDLAQNTQQQNTDRSEVLVSENSQIEDLKSQISKMNSELKERDMIGILLFMVLTLLSLLTLSLFKNNKLRARSNSVLEDKNSALIDERDRAQDSAKIKADFLSTITHELRTPMYAVTGLTHLLLETEPRKDQRDHLETLQSSGEYLLSLIDNILDFNKLEAKKVELEKIPFDLRKRIEDITTSLSNQAKDQINSLSLEFDPDIPSRLVGDPVKISQILMNLIGNAIKFTKNGNIWIRVNQLTLLENKCSISIEVEDNGKGITEEKQSDIFENFTQEGSSITREYGGTGLGLAIVKNLVGLMGGTIKLESKLGRGSVFSFDLWFDLPDSNKFMNDASLKDHQAKSDLENYPEKKLMLRSNQISLTNQIKSKDTKNTTKFPIDNDSPNDLGDKESKVSNNQIISIKEATPRDLIAKKILIVEDNKINQMITRKILEGRNFDCEVANNGIEALGMIKVTDYDLVLMDIHMPGMDGKECTREVRRFDRELPIIALTAVTLDESEKEFYEIGFDDIIPKPFKMEEFFDKIEKAFSNYQIY